MLSRFDDLPIHQTPEPLAHRASSDRNFYDRYWFNGFDRDGEFYFGVAMGLYPNREILDCAFSIVRDGEQHSFHGSRRAPAEPGETAVGPFRIEVLEPMRRLRLTIDENETGIACDLVFSARTGSVDEGRQTLLRGTRPVFDATRFAQFGRWQGEIRYGGESIAVDSARVYGTKDRSWGIRPVGEPETGGAPAAGPPQFFFLWAPVHWQDRCTHFGVYEDAEGVPWHEGGAITPAYASDGEIPGVEDPATEKMATVSHEVTYEKGTRWARSARLTLVARSGENHVIELEPLLRFQMKGIGYLHPDWGHGRWKGELEIAAESWQLDEINPLAPDGVHVQQLMRARMDGREGIGILEQICLGPHAPSGFTEFLDGAK